MKKIIALIIFTFLFLNSYSQQGWKYFKGTCIPFDSSYITSVECAINFKSMNKINAIIKKTTIDVKIDKAMIDEYRTKGPYSNSLINKPDSFVSKLLKSAMLQEPTYFEYYIGLYDINKKIFNLFKKESFETEDIDKKFNYYNFLYKQNRLIDLDTIGPNISSITKLEETNVEISNLKEELEKKVRNDVAISKDKEGKLNREKMIEMKRISFIKKATIGDLMIYTQDWEKIDSYLLGYYKKSTSYKMIIKCNIERIEGEKFQVRIADVSSNNEDNYSTPDINGIKISKGDIIWIKPFKDKNWFWGEDE